MTYKVVKEILITAQSGVHTPLKEEIRNKVGEDDNTRTKIVQAAKWICESPRKGLMLYGNVGAGKTILAFCFDMDSIDKFLKFVG